MLSISIFLNEGVSSMITRRVVNPVIRKATDLYASRAARKEAREQGQSYVGHEAANSGVSKINLGISNMHLDRLGNAGIAGKVASMMYVEDMSPLVAAGQVAGMGLKKVQPQMQAVGDQVRTSFQDAGSQTREALSSWGSRLTQHYDH